MDDMTKEKDREMEVDIQRLAGEIWKKFWVIVLASVLGAVITFLGTYYLITPQYQSSAMFYVNNKSISVGGASVSLESGDITAAKSLVDSYIVILQTRESLNDVIDFAGVDRTYDQLQNMISAAAVNSTEIFEVVVTSPDPYEAEKIANAIAYILPKRISSIIEGTSAKVVDNAVTPVKPSSPSYTINTLVGFMLGFALSVGMIVLWVLFDITIRSEEDISMSCKHPVLASVPDMEAPSKGGYYYGYGARKKDTTKSGAGKKPVLIGGGINFAAAEAYKLLRTKLQFSFADDNTSRVIGVSSALTGEGKSISSVNLAYTLSQLDKKVLLIDCDMRRPSLSAKLPIIKVPGLSNYLSGLSHLEDLFQPCGIEGDPNAFSVISAGRNPPNPVELLSSTRMEKMLDRLRQSYDYIILDLPPVGEVSDALAVAKLTDGVLLVVRQNYCNRVALNSAVRQFEFVESRILGVVSNCASENVGAYSKKYYKKYHGRYEGSYSRAFKSVNGMRGEGEPELAEQPGAEKRDGRT
jgi:capsular exopolysaccharide synthesis family protein